MRIVVGPGTLYILLLYPPTSIHRSVITYPSAVSTSKSRHTPTHQASKEATGSLFFFCTKQRAIQPAVFCNYHSPRTHCLKYCILSLGVELSRAPSNLFARIEHTITSHPPYHTILTYGLFIFRERTNKDTILQIQEQRL